MEGKNTYRTEAPLQGYGFPRPIARNDLLHPEGAHLLIQRGALRGEGSAFCGKPGRQGSFLVWLTAEPRGIVVGAEGCLHRSGDSSVRAVEAQRVAFCSRG